jgi:hypothetical protein
MIASSLHITIISEYDFGVLFDYELLSIRKKPFKCSKNAITGVIDVS